MHSLDVEIMCYSLKEEPYPFRQGSGANKAYLPPPVLSPL